MQDLTHRFRAATVSVVAALLAFSVPLAVAQEHKEFRIGGVLSFSGPFSPIGEGMKKGVELAIEQRGAKVLGAPIKVTWEDDETKPQVAVQKTTRLLAEGTNMLFGAVSSASTIAMMKLNEKRKVPLIVTISSSDDITGKEKNPYTFRTTNSTEMENRMMAEYVSSTGKKKLYAVISDYSAGRDLWADLRAKLEARGVTVVGEDFTALGGKDYSVLINKVAKSDADIAAVILIGNDSITFLKQAEQVKLKESKQLFGTMFMDEMIGVATGSAGVGVASTLRYHATINTAANQRFVAAYQKKYGEWPSQYAGQAYDGMSWFLDVVDGSKSWDPDLWVKAFSGSSRKESVAGVKYMRPCDNQAEQPGFFGQSVTGKTPGTPVAMQISQRYEARQLFDACK